jgi:hypothetical protein
MALRESIRTKGTSESGNNKIIYPPELTLWASMMDLALNDYTSGIVTGSHTEHYQSAKDWIFGVDQNYPTSFDSICYLFNINPDAAKVAIKTDPVNIKLRLAGKFKRRNRECTTTS